MKKELRENDEYTITVYTYQSPDVLNKLKQGKTYIASYKRGMFTDYEDNETKNPYRELARVLGLKNCPIFGALDKEELWNMMLASSLETSNRTELLTLEVPMSQVHETEYYTWTDYIYALEDPKGFEEESGITIEELENQLRHPGETDLCQIVIDKIEPEWLVNEEKQIGEKLIYRGESDFNYSKRYPAYSGKFFYGDEESDYIINQGVGAGGVVDYGNFTPYELDDSAKLFKGYSSEDYCFKNGLNKKSDKMIKQFLLDAEIDNNIINKYSNKDLTLDDVYDDELCDQTNNPNVNLAITQYLAKQHLEKLGYDGVEWTHEDDLTPNQYQIWNLNVITPKTELTESVKNKINRKSLNESKTRSDLDDLTGKQFGELTVLEHDKEKSKGKKDTYWKCRCSCGKITSVARKHLLDGSIKSCGHTKRQNGLDHTDNFNGMRDRQNKYNTNLEVIRNQKMQPNNTSGVKGVHYNKTRGRWVAEVSVGGKNIRRDFKNKEDAIKYRQELVDTYYKPKIDSAIKAGDLKEDISQKEYKDFEKKMQEDTLNKILTNFKHCQISNSPQGGSEYILFDGKFLSLGNLITHLQFEDYLERVYKISLSYLPSGIQVNDSKHEPIIRLSITKRPNTSEYYAIEEWLEHLYNSDRKTNILDLTLLKEPIANYDKKSINLLDYDKEEIIQIIKDYFRYGCLIESLKEDLELSNKSNIENKLISKLKSQGYKYTYKPIGWYDEKDEPIDMIKYVEENGDMNIPFEYHYRTYNNHIFEGDNVDIVWDINEKEKEFIILSIWSYEGAKKGEASQMLYSCLEEIPNNWTIGIKDNINWNYWHHMQDKFPNYNWVNESLNLQEDLELSNEYDSEGNQLTIEQAEFFKNSKVRDENGRLLVCYHATNKSFNTFRTPSYFTDSYFGVVRYGDGKHIFNTYLNIEKPFIFDYNDLDSLDNTYYYNNQEYIEKELGIYDEELWNAIVEIFDGNNISYSYLIEIVQQMNKYDGLILLNSPTTWGLINQYIAFKSNQIKSITNKNPNKVISDIKEYFKTGKVPHKSELQQFRESEQLKESLKEIKDGYITDSPYDILNLITNKPKAYRILYDKNIDKYMIGDGWNTIHLDLLESAIKDGYYSNNEKINEILDELVYMENYDINHLILAKYNYFDTGTTGEYDIEPNIDPYLIVMFYLPKSEDNGDAYSDGYDKEYKGNNGTIYTRDSDLEDCELYKLWKNYNKKQK